MKKDKCKNCGRKRKIYAKGMCQSCYLWNRIKNDPEKYAENLQYKRDRYAKNKGYRKSTIKQSRKWQKDNPKKMSKVKKIWRKENYPEYFKSIARSNLRAYLRNYGMDDRLKKVFEDFGFTISEKGEG